MAQSAVRQQTSAAVAQYVKAFLHKHQQRNSKLVLNGLESDFGRQGEVDGELCRTQGAEALKRGVYVSPKKDGKHVDGREADIRRGITKVLREAVSTIPELILRSKEAPEHIMRAFYGAGEKFGLDLEAGTPVLVTVEEAEALEPTPAKK